MSDRRYGLTLRRRKLRLHGQAQLLESNFARILAALLVSAVLLSYTVSISISQADSAWSQINTIATTVLSRFESMGDFSGLSTAALARSGSLPQAWISGSGIRSVFNTAITTVPDAGGLSFSLGEANVPQSACVRLATVVIAPSQVSVTVNGMTYVARPATVAQATASCVPGRANLLSWSLK